MTRIEKTLLAVAGAALMALGGAARADINVGVTVSATGPAASLGIPEKNTFALMPKTIAGQKVNYIVLDDASDTTRRHAWTVTTARERMVDPAGHLPSPGCAANTVAISGRSTPGVNGASGAGRWDVLTS